MTLGSDIAAALPFLRAQAESRMTETLTFFTETDGEDPVTLQPVKVESVIASGIPGRLRIASRDSRDVEVAGQEPVLSQMTISVPVGSVKVGPSVLIRVTATRDDQGVVGEKYRTKDFPAMGQATAWRYPVEHAS